MNLTRTMITVLIGWIVSDYSIAQQEPRSTLFWNQYLHTNPAMTGAIYRHNANVQLRNQWMRITGSPTNVWANYAAKIDKINSGIGGSYEYDRIGYTKSQTALVSYAYHIPIKKLFLSVGASGGIKTMELDNRGLFFPVTAAEDPVLRKTYQPVFQCDFGLVLRSEKWNIGLSATQLNRSTFKDSTFSFTNEPHFWFFADYAFNLGENWKLTPRIQTYTDGISMYSCGAVVAAFKNAWFGATTSFGGSGISSVGGTIGYDITGRFRLGYAHEFWIGNHGWYYKSGTNEFVLSYLLK